MIQGSRGTARAPGGGGGLRTRALRTCALAALAVLGASALAAADDRAYAQQVVAVPSDWAYAPDGLAVGDMFRLLFTPDVATFPDDGDIRDMAAGSGLHGVSEHFRVLKFGATDRDEVRRHTYTEGAGVPIYWVGGDRIADNYDDFYAGGTPGASAASRNEHGQREQTARYSYGISPVFRVVADGEPRVVALPLLRVASGASVVTEGADLSFTLLASVSGANFTINYRVTESGSALAADSRGDFSLTTTGLSDLTIATVEDDTDERDSTVTVTLLPSGTDELAYVLGSMSSSTTVVRDNDPGPLDPPSSPPSQECTKGNPCVSLGALTNNFEGRPVGVSVYVEPPHISSSALQIKFSTSDSGHILASGNNHERTIHAYGRAGQYIMDTVRDCNAGGDNWIDVTLLDGTGYQIKEGTTTTKRVEPNERRPHPDGPGVYIDRPTSPNELTIREGPGATIPISGLFKSGYLACSDLTINYNVAQTNNYLLASETGNFTATIAAGQGASAAGSIPLRGATAGNQGGGTVTITLLPGTGYGISSPSGVTYQIDDSSAGTITPFTSLAEVPPPEVSIGISGNGVEGDPVSFGIGAGSIKPLQAPLPVNVTLSDTGNMLNASDAGLRTIIIPTSGSYTLQVDTINDNIVDGNNTVTLTINPGDGYTLGAPSSMTLNIPDAGNGTAPQELQMTPPPDLAFGLQQVQEPPVVAIDPALVANVTALAAQSHHGHEHVDRWTRVLAAFGEITHDSPMTAAEARANSGKYSSPLWPQIADVLALLEAAAERDQQQQQPAIDPALVSKVKAQAAQSHHGHEHVDRWNRVLAAFGEITHDSPTTAAEARANSGKYSSPLWPQIADVLALLEAGG